MSIVMKVSKDGYNVLTADNADLEFNSELATHAIQSVVTYEFSAGVEDADAVTHNLGFVPKTWVFYAVNSASTYRYRLPILTAVGSGYDYYITDSIIRLHRDGVGGSNYYKIIIFTRKPQP